MPAILREDTQCPAQTLESLRRSSRFDTQTAHQSNQEELPPWLSAAEPSFRPEHSPQYCHSERNGAQRSEVEESPHPPAAQPVRLQYQFLNSAENLRSCHCEEHGRFVRRSNLRPRQRLNQYVCNTSSSTAQRTCVPVIARSTAVSCDEAISTPASGSTTEPPNQLPYRDRK